MIRGEHDQRSVDVIEKAFAVIADAERAKWGAECMIRGAAENLAFHVVRDTGLYHHVIDGLGKDGKGRMLVEKALVLNRELDSGAGYSAAGLAPLDDPILSGRAFTRKGALSKNWTTWSLATSIAKKHDKGLYEGPIPPT